jgi:hypothetical protein
MVIPFRDFGKAQGLAPIWRRGDATIHSGPSPRSGRDAAGRRRPLQCGTEEKKERDRLGPRSEDSAPGGGREESSAGIGAAQAVMMLAYSGCARKRLLRCSTSRDGVHENSAEVSNR